MEHWETATDYSPTATIELILKEEPFMSNYKTILYEKQRHGVLITLNRPNALNAMNQDLLGELDHALGGG